MGRHAVALVALLALATAVGGCGGPAPDAEVAPPASGMPAPPEGMRWQGVNGVVVAVPGGWRTDTDPCGSPDGDTVRFLGPDEPPRWCPGGGTVSSVSSLVVAPAARHLPQLGRLDQRIARRGLQVRHGGVRCRASSLGPCTFVFAVPDAAFAVSYRGPDPQDFVGAMRDSVTRVPDGWTTVPPIRYGISVERAKNQLARAGLTGRSPEVDFPHYATGSRPEPGTVVPDGAEVALTIGDG
jgi:hypothetical protein